MTHSCRQLYLQVDFLWLSVQVALDHILEKLKILFQPLLHELAEQVSREHNLYNTPTLISNPYPEHMPLAPSMQQQAEAAVQPNHSKYKSLLRVNSQEPFSRCKVYGRHAIWPNC